MVQYKTDSKPLRLGRNVVPWVNEIIDRKHSITVGSAILIIGVVLQACPRKGVTLRTQSMPTYWAWRISSAVQMAPAMLQLTFTWLVPESPRWIIFKDRGEEAFEVPVKSGNGLVSQTLTRDYVDAIRQGATECWYPNHTTRERHQVGTLAVKQTNNYSRN
ncbi:hypothetical protein B0J13DRAFT_534653 [Dactylonectria estremocensis]|uniref:Major facilitator superfamily (MFS) profile domain-containing protein n=1 Tax=Dactylonectria estremocensis TaxID=1079267 RepID=A0A9P9D042_9HYPO|nr:hypothetical protein B0J13DRAFT_534653 [Dactylonectria estremocensis]